MKEDRSNLNVVVLVIQRHADKPATRHTERLRSRRQRRDMVPRLDRSAIRHRQAHHQGHPCSADPDRWRSAHRIAGKIMRRETMRDRKEAQRQWWHVLMIATIVVQYRPRHYRFPWNVTRRPRTASVEPVTREARCVPKGTRHVPLWL